ncbi:putative Thioredoxin-like superfamily [Helianthus debilis subsp. tardiflorus]
MAKMERKKPDYIKMQPFGQVPAFQDDDITLFEMAPKVKKERAKPTKKEKSKVESMSEPRHNMAAYLQPEGKISPEFTGIMEYLHRARINYAITTQHTAYQSHIKEFWNSAVIETVDNKEVIRGSVIEKPVVITENTIRARLQLGDQPEDSTSIDLQCQRGLLMRLRYSDNVLANQINKSCMPLRYKFLLHILIHCLSNKRSGYDLSPIELTGLFTALILNKPFNISRYIFDNLKENARRPLPSATQRTSTKFWLYPRFLQMIIDDQIPDLPKAEADVLPVNPMNERTLLIFKSMSKYKESDPIRKLVGHLDVPTYEAPQNNKWRRDASDSDDEEPRLIALADTQLRAKHGIKASSKKSAGSSSAAAHVEVDVNVAAEEVQGVFIESDVRSNVVGSTAGETGGTVVGDTGGSAGGDGGPASQSGNVATDKGKGKVDEPRKLIDESSSSSDNDGGSGDNDSSSEDDNPPPPPGMRKVYDNRGNFRGFERIEKTVRTAESNKDEDYIPAAPGLIRKRKAKRPGIRASKKSKDGSGPIGETAGDTPMPDPIQHSTPPEQQLPPVSDQLTTSEMMALVSSPQTSSGIRTATVDQQLPATPVSGTHARPPLVITGPTGASGQAGQSGSSGPETSRSTLVETLSVLSEAEKIQFLIEQVSELGSIVGRHTRTIEEYRVQRTRDVEAHNKLVSIVDAQNLKIKEHAIEIERLKEANRARDREVEKMKGHSTVLENEAKALRQKHEELSDRYKSRDDRLIEAFKPVHANFKKIDYKVGTLWNERCNALGIVPSRRGDDKDDDAANPDQPAASGSGATASGAAGGSGTSQDAPSAPSTATTGPSEQTETLEASAVLEHVSVEPDAFADLPESSFVQQYHPVTGELLEEGEHVTEMSDERVVAPTELDEVDVSMIDATPLVPDQTDFSSIDEIFIGADPERPVYVGQDNKEFSALDDEYVAEKTAEFANLSTDSPTAQENREKTVNEWRADFLARNPPPLAPLDQVNYMRLEKNQARGRIISWMFIKELHCMVVKRECGLQYFRSLLSILSLPYYDVAVLAQLNVINRVEDKMVDLFAKKIRLERRRGWKDPLYKPQFPRYEQIRFTLDPDTNTTRYRLVYDPPKVMKKIPLLGL